MLSIHVEHTAVEQLETPGTADGNGCYEKQYGASLKALKAELLRDPAIPLLDMLKRSEIRILRRYLYIFITVYWKQSEMKATQCPSTND